MPQQKYTIKMNTLKKAFTKDMEIFENGIIASESRQECALALLPIDCGETDAEWGRLWFESKRAGNVAFIVYAAASNRYLEPEERSIDGYRQLMHKLDSVSMVNVSDMLLYKLSGRYLYVYIEVTGEGINTISNIRVDRQGDNFMQTFPEVYQENNSFFHRYMSIFSSMYNDLEEEIDALPQMLDLDTCDEQLLPVYAKWLGIDVGDGFFETNTLRALVKEAHVLNRMKGTRWCLERIFEIILGEKCIIVERNSVQDYLTAEQYDAYNSLYGDSIYDVTMLVKCSMNETLQSQLQYILDQFLPARCQLHIIQLNNTGALDSHSYLDINARVYNTSGGNLDIGRGLDTMITLV